MVCRCYNNHRNDEVCGCSCHDYEHSASIHYTINMKREIDVFNLPLEYHNGS